MSNLAGKVDEGGRDSGTPQLRESSDLDGGALGLQSTGIPATHRRRRGAPCRPLTLLDGMILIAGAGVSIAAARSQFSDWGELNVISSPASWMLMAINIAGLLLLISSLLILILRLKQPRPAIRRVARQPGVVACFMALSLALGTAYSRLVYLTSQTDDIKASWIDFWSFPTFRPGHETSYAIAALWFIFALGRIGRPEASWIDRAGRLVGWGWISWGVGGSYLSYYFE